MGGHVNQKNPLIRLDNLVAKSPASPLGNPLPIQSFGPDWDKGHTVSPGGEGNWGWRKVALLAAQGPIQPGDWLSWAGWLGPGAVTASPGLGATAAGLGWMGVWASSSFRGPGWGDPQRSQFETGIPEPGWRTPALCPSLAVWTSPPVSTGTWFP